MRTSLLLRTRNLPIILALIMVMTFCFSLETLGAQESSSVLNRLKALESRWGHIQLGGEFKLLADYYHGSYNSKVSGLREDLNLFLQAQLDRSFNLNLVLSQQGFLGLHPNETNLPPVTMPLVLDEAVLRYRSPKLLADMGVFKFSLDPLGLIADHSYQPVHGFALQTGNKDFYFGGYYSRISTNYYNNVYASDGDGELALRLAFPGPKYMWGITVVPSGFSNDVAAGVDFMTGFLGGNLQGELAWYSPSPDKFDTYDGVFGWLISWHKDLKESYLVVKAGAFQTGFLPYSSILYEYNGAEAVEFRENTYGAAVAYGRSSKNNWGIKGQVGILYPFSTSSPPYQQQPFFSCRATKTFSPATSLELGYDHQPNWKAPYGRFLMQFTALF